MADYGIRKIALNDLDDLVALYEQLHEGKGHSVDRNLFRVKLAEIGDAPHIALLGVETEGRIAATSMVARVEGLSYGCRPFAVVENVATLKEFRGRGLAAAVVKRCLEVAEGWGCYKAILETGSKEPWKLAFYEKCGFSRGEKTAFIKRF